MTIFRMDGACNCCKPSKKPSAIETIDINLDDAIKVLDEWSSITGLSRDALITAILWDDVLNKEDKKRRKKNV